MSLNQWLWFYHLHQHLNFLYLLGHFSKVTLLFESTLSALSNYGKRGKDVIFSKTTIFYLCCSQIYSFGIEILVESILDGS